MEMTVPSAIQKQVEDAERLQAELYGVKEAPAEPVENTPVPEVAAPEVAPEPVAEPKVEPVQEQKPQDDFERQYKVLRGKYDAEVPRMQHQLREQARQMQELQARLEQAMKQPEKPSAEEKALVTDKDVEDFGSDLIDMVRRASRDETSRELSKQLEGFKKEIAAVLQQVSQVQQHVQLSESDKFWGRVKALIPDWETIDQDQNWIDFLDTAPGYTTETYRELAAKAISAGKADAVAQLVDLWRGPKQPEPAAKQEPNPELQRQIQPSSVKSSTPVNPAAKMYTLAEYEALLDVKNINKYGSKKADEMVEEANRALAEGRVRW